MSFETLFGPLEAADEWLTGLLEGAPLLVALGIAFVLGLRHASDPGPPRRGDVARRRRPVETRAAPHGSAPGGALGHATLRCVAGRACR